MAVVYSKVLLFDPPLIYTAPDTCVFGAVNECRVGHLSGNYMIRGEITIRLTHREI